MQFMQETLQIIFIEILENIMLKRIVVSIILLIQVLFVYAQTGKVEVKVKKKDSYASSRKPQIAIWFTDVDGKYLSTIYVTEKTAKSNWFGFNVERPESLPVWSYMRKSGSEENSNHGKSNEILTDAVTGATPAGKILLFSQEIDKENFPENVSVYIELNESFDYNKYYAKEMMIDGKKYKSVNGQPSIIFKAECNIKNGGSYDFKFLGIGDVAGRNGDISTDVSHMTTALGMIEFITVNFK